jgi:hypothetical protein
MGTGGSFSGGKEVKVIKFVGLNFPLSLRANKNYDI